jgi:uncharacterized protein YndB with AHSA1/START domain
LLTSGAEASSSKEINVNKTYTATASTTINAPASKVWEAITKPELIKKYLFDTDVVSDWKVGSPIVYRGKFQGKPFEDKGKILEIEPEKSLVSTHWSPMSGVPDLPENYHKVSYQLSERDGKTDVTILQDNNASEEEKAHSEANWKTVLEGLKKLLEG